MNLDPFLLLYPKTISKGTIDLNVEAKIIKLLGKNIGINFCDLELDGGFLDMTSKAQVTKKKDTLDIKIKTFFAAKATVLVSLGCYNKVHKLGDLR